MTVSFYLNINREIESISIEKVKKSEPIVFIEKITESLESELEDGEKFEYVGGDTWLKAKLKHVYEPDGSGANNFDRYEIIGLKACAKFI